MSTQYESAINQRIITQCGLPPSIIAPHEIKMSHAACADRVAHEYEREHKLEKGLDVFGDIGAAPLVLLGNPLAILLIVVIIVIFIGWGIKGGITRAGGEAGRTATTRTMKKAGV